MIDRIDIHVNDDQYCQWTAICWNSPKGALLKVLLK